jgi:MscS family membrane protein
VGFLIAAHKDNNELASEYLNTPLQGEAAADLAHQLAVVLDKRLPAKLTQLSDQPQGSLSLLRVNQDLVGTISTAKARLDIVLERVDRGESGMVWLFSSKTLEVIPRIYDELETVQVDTVFPKFLVRTRVFSIPLFEWLVALVGLPLFYLLLFLLGRLLRMFIGWVRRQWYKNPNLRGPEVLPTPVRLLLLALTIHWTLTQVSLSLLARQVWSGIAVMIEITAVVWLLILLNRWGESYALRYFRQRNLSGASSILRLALGIGDLLIIFAGVMLALSYFGVNLTAALAGLGVGGIAVALAAQKTLENVIGGVSLIFDNAVRVGDMLKVGDTVGSVEEITLRSTRIRTPDRTVIRVPNGHIASLSVETLSARDRFWFHPPISLQYGTTAAQIQAVVAGIRELLHANSSVDPNSVRVRFLGFATSSLNVDVVAYVYARDGNHFLEIQERLLLEVMGIVEGAGTQIALPSQIAYLAQGSNGQAANASVLSRTAETKPHAEEAVKSE